MEDHGASRKRPMILAALAAAVALVLGAIVVLSPGPSRATELAVVTPLEPTVSLKVPGVDEFVVLEAPEPVGAGAEVLTDAGGFAAIDYFEGSLTRIGGDTSFTLDVLSDEGPTAIVGDLDLGETYHRVRELSGSGERFEVRTAHAVAAVRGTIFTVVCRVDDCDIAVVDGDVDVVCRMNGDELSLRQGEEVTVPDDCETAGFSPVRPLDLTDPFLMLNLAMDGIDIDELRERLFGPDLEPGTADDPEPDPAGPASGTGGLAAGGGSGGGGSGGGGSGGGGSGGGGSGGGGSGGGGSGGGGSGDGGSGDGGSGDGGSGDGGSGDGGGDSTTTTARPGQTTTSRPGATTTTTRPRGSTTTTRPQTTTTTRPPVTTTTERPREGPPCETGYPPRPC